MRSRDLRAIIKSDLPALGLTFLAGAALGFFLWFLSVPSRTFNSYLFFNNLTESDRWVLALMAGGGAILLALVWVAITLVRLPRSLDWIRTRVKPVLPAGVLLAFVPVLAVAAIETYYVYYVFVLVAGLVVVTAMIAYRTVRPPPGLVRSAPSGSADRICTTLLVGFILAYAVYFVLFTLGRHYSFHSYAFDLGWQQQAFYTLLRTGNPRITLWATLNHLGNHFQPLYYLLAPLYAIYQDAAMLLVLQSVLLSTAAIPIYLIARRRLNDPYLALTIAVVYLLYPPLHGVNNYDFHGLALLIPITAFLLYALECRNNRFFWIFLILGLMTREDAPVTLSGIGLYLLLQRDRRRQGLWVVAICVAYFLLIGMIMSALDGNADLGNYWALTLPGERSFTGVLATLTTNPHYVMRHVFLDPNKLEYLIHLLLPLAFLPLLAGKWMILVIPGLAIMLLSNTFFNYSIATPYSSHVTAQLFFLATLGIERARNWRGGISTTVIVIPLLVAGMTMNLEFGLLLSKRFPGFLQPSDRLQNAYSLFGLIPADASVATDTRFVPHLAGREEIYMLHSPNANSDYILVDIAPPEPAIDRHEAWYRGTQFPGVYEARRLAIDRLESGDYGVVRFQADLVLLARGHDTSGNRTAIRDIRNAPAEPTPELIEYFADPAEDVDEVRYSAADYFYQMLRSNNAGIVILAVNGQASSFLSYVCLKYMLLKGSSIHTLHRGGSYIAVVENGIFEFELIDNNRMIEVSSRINPLLQWIFPDRDVQLASSGDGSSGFASIVISGKEYATGNAGINALILDSRGQVKEAISYDIGR